MTVQSSLGAKPNEVRFKNLIPMRVAVTGDWSRSHK